MTVMESPDLTTAIYATLSRAMEGMPMKPGTPRREVNVRFSIPAHAMRATSTSLDDHHLAGFGRTVHIVDCRRTWFGLRYRLTIHCGGRG